MLHKVIYAVFDFAVARTYSQRQLAKRCIAQKKRGKDSVFKRHRVHGVYVSAFVVGCVLAGSYRNIRSCLCASSMRRQAISKYFGSRSMPMNCSASASATTPTVPLPM